MSEETGGSSQVGVVVINGASKSLGGKQLWQNVEFDVQPGQLCGIVGPSGCGKSTLLACLGLLTDFDEGEYHLCGSTVNGLSRRQIRRQYRDVLGFIFQNYALIPHESVDKNLAIAQRFQPGTRADKVSLRKQAAEKFGIGEHLNRVAGTLSGGEQQRVALGRLWLKKPKVVLADEPSAALDSANEQIAIVALREIADNGAAVILATHSPTLREACDRVIDLDRYVQEQSPRLAPATKTGRISL